LEYLSELGASFLLFLNGQPPAWIYFFLFVGAFMENVVPPIPGDTLIVFGAYLAGIGMIQVWPAYACMWVGSALGCMGVYGLAYWKGRAFFLKFQFKFATEAHLNSAEAWFERYGDRIVILNRFLPTARAFVGIVAGITRMNPWRMTLYVAVGTFLWNSLLMYFGLMVGENWEIVIAVMKTYNRVVLFLMAAGGIGFWILRRRKRLAQEAGAPVSDSSDRGQV
jgi:membrane protein DedA with SNARE-associated domain